MESTQYLKGTYEYLQEGGTIHSFEICDGVSLAFYELKMDQWVEEDIQPANIIEINHCEFGRYECAFGEESFYYLGEGEMAVSRMSDKKTGSGFPLGVYNGINILIDLDCDQTEFDQLLKMFAISKEVLLAKWRKILPCRITRESEQTKRIIRKLYEREKSMNLGYLRLCFLELMLVFMESGECTIIHQHFSRKQVEKAKHICVHLHEDLEQEITLKELARDHQTSESTIKRCFQAIYGKSPNQYRRELRMQQAAKLLLETTQSVAEIGLQVGYQNPSKFSQAFQTVLSQPPSTYRNEKKSH